MIETKTLLRETPFDPEYLPGARNALVSCLRIQPEEKVTFLRLSAGEAINRIRAERSSPQASILYGIGLPSMLTLKADGLLEPYKSPEAAAIPDKYKDPEGYWTGTDVDFIGFASNKKFLQEKGLKAPKTSMRCSGQGVDSIPMSAVPSRTAPKASDP